MSRLRLFIKFLIRYIVQGTICVVCKSTLGKTFTSDERFSFEYNYTIILLMVVVLRQNQSNVRSNDFFHILVVTENDTRKNKSNTRVQFLESTDGRG